MTIYISDATVECLCTITNQTMIKSWRACTCKYTVRRQRQIAMANAEIKIL